MDSKENMKKLCALYLDIYREKRDIYPPTPWEQISLKKISQSLFSFDLFQAENKFPPCLVFEEGENAFLLQSETLFVDQPALSGERERFTSVNQLFACSQKQFSQLLEKQKVELLLSESPFCKDMSPQLEAYLSAMLKKRELPTTEIELFVSLLLKTRFYELKMLHSISDLRGIGFAEVFTADKNSKNLQQGKQIFTAPSLKRIDQGFEFMAWCANTSQLLQVTLHFQSGKFSLQWKTVAEYKQLNKRSLSL